MKIDLDLGVVHDHGLGWDYSTGEFRGGRAAPSFPHNFGTTRDASDAPGDNRLEFGSASPPGSPGAGVGAGAIAETTGG